MDQTVTLSSIIIAADGAPSKIRSYQFPAFRKNTLVTGKAVQFDTQFKKWTQPMSGLVYGVVVFYSDSSLCDQLSNTNQKNFNFGNEQPGILNDQSFAKYYELKMICTWEFPFTYEVGSYLWPAMFNRGYNFPGNSDDMFFRATLMFNIVASYQGIGIAKSMFNEKSLIEIKFYNNEFSNLNTVGGKTEGSTATVFIVGDALRNAYTQFAMGVNDGHFMASQLAFALSATSSADDALEMYGQELDRYEWGLIRQIKEVAKTKTKWGKPNEPRTLNKPLPIVDGKSGHFLIAPGPSFVSQFE